MYLRVAFFVLLGTQVVADTRLDRHMGKALFERIWVPAPSSARATDGLGPLFNARACAACHPGGGAVAINEAAGSFSSTGLVARFGDGLGGGDPYYGQQLQTAAITGLSPEGSVMLRDGVPVLTLDGTELAPGTRVGLRRAPTLAGRGMIEQVTDIALLALSDPDDLDGDGVSGRVRLDGVRIGRFGWKAEHVTLADQVASAFAVDLGLSSARHPVHSGDCTARQTDCVALQDGSDGLGGGFELSEAVIDLVTDYVAELGQVRPGDPEGLALFTSIGCAACHRPAMETRDGHVAIYSDLLLHHMGDDLADGFAQGDVEAGEWRTAPLIGLAGAQGRLLHDGRAANIREAIGWHGGEGAASREAFSGLHALDQRALIEFVSGL